jgi:Fe-S-cluster containining protein
MEREAMDLKTKKKQLLGLYADFATRAADHQVAAVCTRGCADCCTSVGNVDATTLEAYFILEHLKTFSPSKRQGIKLKVKQNKLAKESFTLVRCGFLLENDTCAIYPVRPFSCRRLYSVTRCAEQGPTVHRQVWMLAREIEAAIQELDHTGYSGHLSYLLHLLQQPEFRKLYLNGGFAPEAIREYAVSHELLINRFVKRMQDG